MTEEHNPICGWTKLFHPRGPQVTLPLPPDPAAALAAVSAALDAGWLVTAPGLEEGEEKEQVGWVLKSIFSNEGRETPFVLLYSANEALTWSFLKVYLNTEQDVAAFEHASRMKLTELPEYVGQDKPQRSASGRTDKYIVPAPRPFGVVFKKNPKHDATEAGKMKPARLFVRWAESLPAAQPADESGCIHDGQRKEIERRLEELAELGVKINITAFCKWAGSPLPYSLYTIPAARLPVIFKDLDGRIAAKKQEAAQAKMGGAE
jgi:hypothetical protein